MSKLSPGYLFLLKQIVDARKTSGVTQVELAKKLSKPQSFVSKFERGERRLDVFEYITIASELNVDVKKLSEIFTKSLLGQTQ